MKTGFAGLAALGLAGLGLAGLELAACSALPPVVPKTSLNAPSPCLVRL